MLDSRGCSNQLLLLPSNDLPPGHRTVQEQKDGPFDKCASTLNINTQRKKLDPFYHHRLKLTQLGPKT